MNISNLFTSLLVVVLIYINIKLLKNKQKGLPIFILMEFISIAESHRIGDILVIILCLMGLMMISNWQLKIKFHSSDNDDSHHGDDSFGGDGFGGDGGGGDH